MEMAIPSIIIAVLKLLIATIMTTGAITIKSLNTVASSLTRLADKLIRAERKRITDIFASSEG